MRCTTEHFSRSLMYQSVKDGRSALGRMIVKFVGGIRGKREQPVTKKQIEKWFRGTDNDFINSVMLDLIGDGRLCVDQRSLNSARRANGSYVYYLPEE